MEGNYSNPEKFALAHRERYAKGDIVLEELKSMFDLEQFKGKVVLDLGCGDGSYTKVFADTGAKMVIGLDSSSEMLKMANETNSADNIDYVVGTMEYTPLKNEFVDFVHARFSIQYSNNVKKSFEEMHRVLKEGGEAFVVLPHPDYLYKTFESQIRKDGLVTIEIYPGFEVTYPYHSMNEYLDKNILSMFSIESIKPINLSNNSEDDPDVLILRMRKIFKI
jgi:ubiquinone/menaquinone biosynthesis C-methylase UbiE